MTATYFESTVKYEKVNENGKAFRKQKKGVAGSYPK